MNWAGGLMACALFAGIIVLGWAFSRLPDRLQMPAIVILLFVVSFLVGAFT